VVSEVLVVIIDLSGKELEGTVLSGVEVAVSDGTDSNMVVSEKVVEYAVLPGIELVVSVLAEVIMVLFSEVVVCNVLSGGEMAFSDVGDSNVVASGEVAKYSGAIGIGVVVPELLVVFVELLGKELEVPVRSGGEVAVAAVVDSNVVVSGEVVK